MCLDLKPAVKTNNATCTVKKRAGYTDAQSASFQRVYIPLQPIGPPYRIMCMYFWRKVHCLLVAHGNPCCMIACVKD